MITLRIRNNKTGGVAVMNCEEVPGPVDQMCDCLLDRIYHSIMGLPLERVPKCGCSKYSVFVKEEL